MGSVLIIDDDEAILSLLRFGLSSEGHHVHLASSLTQGLEVLQRENIDVVVLDIIMPDGNGLDHVGVIRGSPSRPEVIIITASGDSGAELAIRGGAWDYVQKPFSLKEVALPVARALDYRRESRSRPTNEPPISRERIIGASPRFLECINALAMSASNDSSVLITGETGTGKELFARGIHDNSPRCHRPFVVVDCAALPPTLIESVLFGYRKGSFTGADNPNEGLVKAADHGTLFLDEVGELPMEAQKVFLRLLQEKSYRPIGSRSEIRSDFRLISATNRDLEALCAEGRFRQDLLFRLRSMTIELPPLRERAEDLKSLVMFHVARLCERFKLPAKAVSPELFEYLAAYSWPGNVRELVGTLEGAITVGRYEQTLLPQHLPAHIRIHFAKVSDARPAEPSRIVHPSDSFGDFPTLKEFRRKAVQQAERRYLDDLMQRVQGDVRTACRLAGLSRSRFYDLLKSHDLSSRAQ